MSAAANYRTATAYLQSKDLDLTEEPDEHIVSFSVQTSSAEFVVHFRAPDDSDLMLVHAVMDFEIPEVSRNDVALFLTRVNFGLGVGNFEMDLDDGEVRFKASLELGGTAPTPALLDPLFGFTLAAMNKYVPGISAVVAGLDPEAALGVIEAM